MKKQPLFITVLLIVALLSLAIPSSAYAGHQPIGERISLWYSNLEFPAGSPFHIQHGWLLTSNNEAIGIFDFTLEVDGVLLSGDIKLFSEEIGDPNIITRQWLYNFPDGMTGTHTFTGHWYAPCQFAVTYSGFQGPCDTPNEKVETITQTLVVDFISSP